MKVEDRSLVELFSDGLSTIFIVSIYILSLLLPVFVFRLIFSSTIIFLFPFIPETYLMNRNLKLAMPEKCFFERFFIILKVWISLALFFAEYCYVYRYNEKKLRQIVKIKTNVLGEIKGNKNGKIFISGHFANWELSLAFLSKTLKQKINVVYRKSNNIFLERFVIQMLKNNNHNINMIAKQENAAMKIIRALKNCEIVVILLDQRDDNGKQIDFFGIPANTNNSPYLFFKKMDIDLYYFCCLRKEKLYKYNLYGEKLNFDKNIEEDEFLAIINKKIEKSVRMSPWQWFWVHSRWKIRNKVSND